MMKVVPSRGRGTPTSDTTPANTPEAPELGKEFPYMKRIALIIAVVAALIVAAPAVGYSSTYLSKKQAKHSVTEIATDDDVGGPYFEVDGCYRFRVNVVKCVVSFYEDEYGDEFVCGAAYRAKVYKSDPENVYVARVWDNCD
jgi:hypothetical protein